MAIPVDFSPPQLETQGHRARAVDDERTLLRGRLGGDDLGGQPEREIVEDVGMGRSDAVGGAVSPAAGVVLETIAERRDA